VKIPVIFNFCRAICRIVASVFFDLKAYGLENVPRTGGALMVANHASYLDPALVGVRIYRPLSFMAKSELFDIPVFGWIIRHCNAFPVQQGKGDRAAIEQTIQTLKSGHILNLFPEGSRTADGQLQKIQKGVALIAKRAGVPIVPAVLIGSFEAWPKGRVIFQSHPVRVLYGPPIDVSRMKAEEITLLIERRFKELLAELRAIIGEELAP
jgi:1-acyl-sn-glycerol-3-phosphate acyltransferase